MIYCKFCGNPTEFMTLGQVAQALGLSGKTIARYIRNGRFPGATQVQSVHSNHEWKIPVSAVLPLMEMGKDED